MTLEISPVEYCEPIHCFTWKIDRDGEEYASGCAKHGDVARAAQDAALKMLFDWGQR